MQHKCMPHACLGLGMQPCADRRGFAKARRCRNQRQLAGHTDTEPLGYAWARDKGWQHLWNVEFSCQECCCHGHSIVSALRAQESACDRCWGSAAELTMLCLFYMTSFHYTMLQRGFTRKRML